MGQKVKWTVQQIKSGQADLLPTDVLYTKRIIPFIRKVTREDIADSLQVAGLLTPEISKIIESS